MAQLFGDWEKFRKCLQKLGNIDYRKLHEQAGEAIIANTQQRFRDGKDPEGKPWKHSQKKGQTLVDTRRLRNSITKKVYFDHVEVGTNVRYAAIHQYGGTIKPRRKKWLRFKSGGRWAMKKKVKIPARPFIGIGEDDILDIQEICEKTIEEALK